MASEDYKIFKVLRQKRIQEAEFRRNLNTDDFGAASQLAAQAGMKLLRKTEAHYQLVGQNDWLLNIYPGNQRLYHDRNRLKPPFLKIKDNWMLTDVVHAAISAFTNTDSFADEIENKIVTDEQRIHAHAYYLWQSAGCPCSDGNEFWFQAQKEMRGH